MITTLLKNMHFMKDRRWHGIDSLLAPEHAHGVIVIHHSLATQFLTSRRSHYSWWRHLSTVMCQTQLFTKDSWSILNVVNVLGMINALLKNMHFLEGRRWHELFHLKSQVKRRRMMDSWCPRSAGTWMCTWSDSHTSFHGNAIFDIKKETFLFM